MNAWERARSEFSIIFACIIQCYANIFIVWGCDCLYLPVVPPLHFRFILFPIELALALKEEFFVRIFIHFHCQAPRGVCFVWPPLSFALSVHREQLEQETLV